MGSLADAEIVGVSAVEWAEAIRGRVLNRLNPRQVTATHLERIRAPMPQAGDRIPDSRRK
jgi:hypothetical protein